MFASAQDGTYAARVFADFMLPSFEGILKRVATKRHALLRMMYAFSATNATARMQTIRTLQQCLNNLSVFVHCLTVSVFLEDQFNVRCAARWIRVVLQRAVSRSSSSATTLLARAPCACCFCYVLIVAPFDGSWPRATCERNVNYGRKLVALVGCLSGRLVGLVPVLLHDWHRHDGAVYACGKCRHARRVVGPQQRTGTWCCRYVVLAN